MGFEPTSSGLKDRYPEPLDDQAMRLEVQVSHPVCHGQSRPELSIHYPRLVITRTTVSRRVPLLNEGRIFET